MRSSAAVGDGVGVGLGVGGYSWDLADLVDVEDRFPSLLCHLQRRRNREWCPVRRMSALISSSLSCCELLGAESVQLGGGTDFHMKQLASALSMCGFHASFLFVQTRSTATALRVLRCMNAATGAVKAFVDSSFSPTLAAVSLLSK